jgi:protein-disulfide isomerase
LANLRHINPDNFNERLSQFARERGVDPDQAVAALNDKRLAALVDQEYQDGVARGIARTPTIIVNGTPFVETFTFEQVAKAIDASLAASK